MNKYHSLVSILALSFLMTGCYGASEIVETGQVGKILGSRGLGEKIIQPSAFRMAFCSSPGSVCPRLVRLQVTKHTENVASRFN